MEVGFGKIYHKNTPKTVIAKCEIKSSCQITNQISNHTPESQIILAQISNKINIQILSGAAGNIEK